MFGAMDVKTLKENLYLSETDKTGQRKEGTLTPLYRGLGRLA